MKKGDLWARGRALYARIFYPNGGGDYESAKGLDNAALGLSKEDLDEATKMAVDMVERGWVPEFMVAMMKQKQK